MYAPEQLTSVRPAGTLQYFIFCRSFNDFNKEIIFHSKFIAHSKSLTFELFFKKKKKKSKIKTRKGDFFLMNNQNQLFIQFIHYFKILKHFDPKSSCCNFLLQRDLSRKQRVAVRRIHHSAPSTGSLALGASYSSVCSPSSSSSMFLSHLFDNHNAA